MVSLSALPGCHYPDEPSSAASTNLPNAAYSKQQDQFYCSQALRSSLPPTHIDWSKSSVVVVVPRQDAGPSLLNAGWREDMRREQVSSPALTPSGLAHLCLYNRVSCHSGAFLKGKQRLLSHSLQLMRVSASSPALMTLGPAVFPAVVGNG